MLASLPTPAASQAHPNGFEVNTRPGLSSVRPLKDPVKITVRLSNLRDGISPDMVFHVRLLAPPSQGFWSTDFPLIEGTELFSVSLPAPRGVASMQYIFPIRGSYQLEVSANRGGPKGTVFLEIDENRSKLAFLAAFLIGLFFLSFVAGRVFTGRGSAAVSMLLFVCLGLLWFGLAADSGASDRGQGGIEVSAARVGIPSRIRWSLPGRAEASGVAIGITQVEKGTEVFRLEDVKPRGPFEFEFQFVDASPHRVKAVATIEGTPPLVVERIVNVAASDPPRWELFRVILYFLSVMTAGLIAGRFSRRRR